jgi:tetratricopeptide (TPR) repeat protein
MAFCTNCGNKMDDGAKFCPSCGTRGDTAEEGGAVKSGLCPLNAGDETNPETWRAAGDEFNKNGEYFKAVSAYSMAIELAPKNPLYYKLRGNTYLDTEEYDKSVADQSEAIRLDPR